MLISFLIHHFQAHPQQLGWIYGWFVNLVVSKREEMEGHGIQTLLRRKLGGLFHFLQADLSGVLKTIVTDIFQSSSLGFQKKTYS